MKRQIINPESEAHWLELRKHDLTSTDVADLFGVGRTSLFELWHRKKSLLESDFIGNERTEWGLHLQDGIAAKFAKDHKWTIRRMSEYIRIPDLRLGSSYDFEVVDTDADRSTHGILEVKNVGYDVYSKDWIIDTEDDFIEAPPHIELQIQHQFLVGGYTYGYIGACISGNQGKLLPRLPNENVINAIKTKAARFWKSIDENNPPEPNFSVDAEFISKLYQYSEPGKVIDVSGNAEMEAMVREYQLAQEDFKDAETRKKAVKAKVLMAIGDAEKVLGNGFSISAGLVAPGRVEAYDRAGYRMFKPTIKKDFK